MEKKSDGEGRNEPDRTQNEHHFSPFILANIKKEPTDDYVEERNPLQTSSHCYRPSVCNSDIRNKTENPESGPCSKPICEVIAENKPRKRTAEESSPFLLEKLELIRKRFKKERPESPPPVVDDDVSCDKAKATAKKVFKLVPLSQIRNVTAKGNIKLVPISEIKNIRSISLEEHLLNGSAPATPDTPSAPVTPDTTSAPVTPDTTSAPPATPDTTSAPPATPDCKSGEHQLSGSDSKWLKRSSKEVFSTTPSASPKCESTSPATPESESDESEAERFNTDIMNFFNVCSTIDKNDTEQGLEYISTVPLDRNFGMFYMRNKRFGEKRQQKVSKDTLATPNQESRYFGIGVPVVKRPAPKPIRDGVLEVSGKASNASSCGLQPAVACSAQPDYEAAVSCSNMPLDLQSVSRTISKLASKVLGTAVVLPSCKLQPSNNNESSLLKPHSSENNAGSSAAKFAPQITRIAPVVTASNQQQPKASCPAFNYHADESTPGIPSSQELQDILSLLKFSQSGTVENTYNAIPSASVIAQTAEILNRHRGSFDSPTQPPTTPSVKGQRSPVVNRFLTTKNVDFN